jgi:acyl-CoA synthetase (AMP-forming)/AMP-acid ligase II/thioesterase domain-containing protein/acyl carrier protein
MNNPNMEFQKSYLNTLANDDRDVIGALRFHARNTPNKLAFVFLEDGDIESQRLTFLGLLNRVLEVASHLEKKVGEGERAILLYPQGCDFVVSFLACLVAGIIAIPTPPPESGRMKRTLPRLNKIISDAQVTHILTNNAVTALLGQTNLENVKIDSFELINTELISGDASSAKLRNTARTHDLAYLQYSSGSTSMPKAVAITNKQLSYHLKCIQISCGYNTASVSINWLPHFHDGGLVEGILVPLFNGTSSYLMAPFSFIRRPYLWLKAISKYRVTHALSTNFGYRRCVERISKNKLSDLNLSCLTSALIGAEPINHNVIQKFYDKFKAAGFKKESMRPCYGLAENTLVVTRTPLGRAPYIGKFCSKGLGLGEAIEVVDEDRKSTYIVGSGKPIHDVSVVIVDPNTQTMCKDGLIGEVWVAHAGAASNYWPPDDSHRAVFKAKLKESPTHYLRTGDLGFIHGDELFISGRIKDTIIIEGVNHYAHDIEWSIEQCHSSIRVGDACAAFSIMSNDSEHLVIVAEVNNNERNYEEIYLAVILALREYHEVKLYKLVLIKQGNMAKTSSGKLQRSLCKKQLAEGVLETVWERVRVIHSDITTTAENLHQKTLFNSERNTISILLEMLASIIRQPACEIDIYQPISLFGMDSLDVLTFSCEIEDYFNVKVPLSEIITSHRCVAQLASLIMNPNWLPTGNCIVPIQPKGDKPALFCIHPAGGNVVNYSALANHLDENQPFYGIQSLGLHSNHSPLTSIHQMAQYYMDEIKIVQPNGPYLISGMCLGGMIALELANLLIKNDDDVVFLGLIDARTPPSIFDESNQSEDMISLRNYLSLSHRKEELAEMRLLADANPPTPIPSNIVSNHPVLKRVNDANCSARDTYVPSIYSKHIHFFWAAKTSGNLGFFHNPKVCWNRMGKQGTTIHEISGHHFEILSEPCVSELARKIQNILNTELNKQEK